jgi:hypothetical protein
MRFGNAFDKPMQSQSSQIVGNPPRADLAGLRPQQWSKVLAKIPIPECALDEEEQQQHVQETLHARIGEAERRCALLPERHWLLQVLERGFTDEAIMADAFNVKQTSVGCKANSAQFGKVFDASADAKVTRIVDSRFGSKGFPPCGTA